jgi:beta-glucosidase/6-phospho-beta-glucosidase/beta-galactosidase
MSNFPDTFLLGAATAAHQVEGNNIHSDFWTMEQLPHSIFKEPSLDAVDHYHRYEEDIRLLKNAGLNAYRFSIEWARASALTLRCWSGRRYARMHTKLNPPAHCAASSSA